MSKTNIAKICSHCKQIKPLSEFYKNKSAKDGYQTYCKICCIAETGQYSQSPKGKKINNICMGRYFQTPKGKQGRKQAQRRYKQANKLKCQARDAGRRAINAGRIKRAKDVLCACGENARYYHHYRGYVKEFQLCVVPLCLKCHWIFH